jgi:hypothetical protein
MAGLTPFQFSSKLLQEQTTSSPAGIISLGGSIGSSIQTTFSWYEMWMNPEKVDINYAYIQKKQHTAGSIVTYHYRRETPIMSVSGYCGWIAIQSQADTNSLQKQMNIALGKTQHDRMQLQKFFTTGKFQLSSEALRPAKDTLVSDNTDNSPRVFLKRLKDIADEPMYFNDTQGTEHYNIKYIKIFTKQYPDGIICEGYYTRFQVPEAADDPQTVAYSFEFVIENMSPATTIDNKLGMFGSTGQGAAIGSVLRSF